MDVWYYVEFELCCHRKVSDQYKRIFFFIFVQSPFHLALLSTAKFRPKPEERRPMFL